MILIYAELRQHSTTRYECNKCSTNMTDRVEYDEYAATYSGRWNA